MSVDTAALDILMPMHMLVGPDCVVRHVGPTLELVIPGGEARGRDFRDIFCVRRPRDFCAEAASRPDAQGTTLHLNVLGGSNTALKAVLTHLPEGEGFLLNMSFGIGVVDAVRAYGLTGRDFAPTDLTIEMLYLVEAKSAAMEQSRNLNRRLQHAKVTAELQAQTDALTGTKNRRALDVEIARLVEVRAPFALLHFDLDFFKDVNDSLGHEAGDNVLKVVSRILAEETRSGDTIARIGGDEFVVVLHGLTHPDRIDRIASRIIERVKEPVDFAGRRCSVAGSIGSTMTSCYAVPDPLQMHRDADAALYQSKRAGRSRHTSAIDVPGTGAAAFAGRATA